jgi:hypothetical protein
MNLSAINLARSIWLFPFIEFNPKGKSLYPFMPEVIEKYKFKKFPSRTEAPDLTKGIIFEEGEFINKIGNIVVLNFTIHNDGLVVDTRSSTDDSDDFLSEILTKISTDYDLPHYEQIIRNKKYVSQLYVTTNKSLELINPKFKKISKYLTGFSSQHFEMGGLSFWSEQAEKTPSHPFTFERVVNVPFVENRYFSAAGLTTNKHLELLEMLEDVLGG